MTNQKIDDAGANLPARKAWHAPQINEIPMRDIGQEESPTPPPLPS